MFATVYLFHYCWSSYLKEILCNRQTVPDIFSSFNIRLNSDIMFSNKHFKLSKKSVYVSRLMEVFQLGTEVQANYFTDSYHVLTTQEDLSSLLLKKSVSECDSFLCSLPDTKAEYMQSLSRLIYS
jgi:hypothetical protein